MKGILGRQWSIKKSCDKMKRRGEFVCLDDWVSAGGGRQAVVTTRT